MRHILGITTLALCGSKNAVKDYLKLTTRTTEPQPHFHESCALPTAKGQSFEKRFCGEIIPSLASKLNIFPPAKLYRVTSHIPHTGDGTIFYNNTIGLVELKNHCNPLPITDRKRFFDSIMINHKNINWAILITSKCSVPNYATRGSFAFTKIKLHDKIIPIAFLCDYDSLGIQSLEATIKVLARGETKDFPEILPETLIERKELSKDLKSKWGSGAHENFTRPQAIDFDF